MISLIAAIGPNRELGFQGKIPWHLRADLLHFKALTINKTVIIGRKTLESLFEYYRRSGRPFPPRQYIIISSHENIQVNHVEYPGSRFLVAVSMQAAIGLAKEVSLGGEVFLIGGASVYREGIKYADKLYLTLVQGQFQADVYFSDYSQFTKVLKREEGEENGIKYSFVELAK